MAENEAKSNLISKLDDSVIKKISAGEVIHRPYNVVKELLENSLDAGATSIVVTLKNGGLKSITIQDNGCGIRKEDLPIACIRHTTSKLNTFEDLRSLGTFGFRGEALASISTVAHVTIVSKVPQSVCGYKAEYVEGSLKAHSSITPVGANIGTTITVENLFYNMPTRKAALKSETAECNLVQDLIARYSILYSSKCGFILKKFGDNTHLVNTSSTSTLLDNINNLYRQNISNHLISFKLRNDKLSFKAEGFFSNADLNLKTFQFLLFINYRLVDCAPLKKAVKDIYQQNLMKGGNPFVLLILQIDPRNIDVNVHPTKAEVFFLYQNEILEVIVKCIDAKMRTKESSQIPDQSSSQQIQTHLNPAFFRNATYTRNNSEQPAVIQGTERKNMPMTTTPAKAATLKPNQKPQSVSRQTAPDNPASRPYRHVRIDAYMQRLDQYVDKRKQESKCRRDMQLESLMRLRSAVYKSADQKQLETILKSSYVGCVDENMLLIQSDLELILVNIPNINEQLFYQIILLDFGNMPIFKFKRPLSLYELIAIYFKRNAPEMSNMKERIDEMIEALVDCSEMLDDYFSLMIDPKTASLVALPRIINGHTPLMAFLPDFMYRLGSNVDWTQEDACLHGVSTELAKFYARTPIKLPTEEDYLAWANTTESVFFPLLKSVLFPSNLANKQTFHTVANITDLYKVFERC